MKTNTNDEGPEELVWHYTTGECFLQIVRMGRLLPTGIGSTPPEKPVLWFSNHPHFEPTAIKTVSHLGEARQLSLQEMYEMGRGLVRFGYPTRRLLPWVKLRKKAKIPTQLWDPLERVARRQGGNPDDWWGTTQGLDVESLVVDVMNRSMTWERVRSLPVHCAEASGGFVASTSGLPGTTRPSPTPLRRPGWRT